MAYQLEYSFYSYTASINAKLYDTAGAQVGITITTGFVSLGSNQYSYLATIPDGHVGTFSVYDSANPTAAMVWSVNPQEAENSSTKQAIADEILKRGMANVDDASPEELSLYHLIAAILNGSMASGVWTAHKSTGATFIASTLTTDAAAVPVTGVST